MGTVHPFRMVRCELTDLVYQARPKGRAVLNMHSLSMSMSSATLMRTRHRSLAGSSTLFLA